MISDYWVGGAIGYAVGTWSVLVIIWVRGHR